MKYPPLILMLLTLVSGVLQGQQSPVAIAIHGGAGTIQREKMTPELEDEYRAKLTESLQAGHAILTAGGSCLDAVESAVRILEDSPLFNAGHGAVLTNEGRAELDASIMEGRTRDAGAVASVRHVRNPISLARRVMDSSPHVMLVGDGAEAFARDQGAEMVENEYFHTERRRKQLREIQEREARSPKRDGAHLEMEADSDLGTVGAVALDREGNLAAATSTGGMVNKKFGRVGDSPLIGAGTYADNETCAVSATGHGEYFIRAAVAYDVAARMRYAGASVAEAAEAVIHQTLEGLGGTGGVIVLDRQGNIAMPFNTAGMYRGSIDKEGNLQVSIFRD
jgi:L-asparaginase / beta-aspartyl-peptidase